MKIQSSAFANDSLMPSLYTCDSLGISPPITFLDVPKDAKSLALIIEDPDAPNGIWDHLVAWNILPDIIGIEEGKIPISFMVGLNSSNKNDYDPPCPPDREHRYFFKLYALDTMLDIPRNSTKSQLEFAMSNHIIAESE